MKKQAASTQNIASTARLEQLLKETESELSNLDPKIEKLEKQLEKLRELKLARQKLITLKLSIQSILKNFSDDVNASAATNVIKDELSYILSPSILNKTEHTSQKRQGSVMVPQTEQRPAGTFLPDLAFRQAKSVLRRKSSINYELFRAIVFNGGLATTEDIKRYLVENAIRQPASGEGFEQVELTDISSRVNYLVRKGLVRPDGRGTFISNLGWTEPHTV